MPQQLTRRILGFAGLPLLSLLTPFLLLPVIARTGGADAWVAVNSGQSVGALGAVLASLGWTLSGPAAVAAASSATRSAVYAESMASRLPATLVALVGSGIVAAVLNPPSQTFLAVLMSSAMVLGGLSPTWFSIGIGSARAIAAYETVPRLVATALSAVLILTVGALWVYPALLIVVVLGGTALYGRRVARSSLRDVLRVNAIRAMWSTRASSGTVMVSASYAQAPMPIATGLASTADAATFGSADRLFRFALTGIQVCMNAFQNWIVDEADGRLDPRRARFASTTTVVIGVLGLLVFAFAGSWGTGLLFGADLAAAPAVSTCYGVAFLAIAVSSALGRLVLIPLGDHRSVFVSTVVGAVVGLSAMLLLGVLLGTVGVAIGFAASEVAVAAYQAVVLLLRRRRTPAATGA